MRRLLNMNQGWEFTSPDHKMEKINIPHTWNAIDGQDGGNDYYRGTCIYHHCFQKPNFDAGNERVYIQFNGVNASADVFLNERSIGKHDGGYTTFRIDITDAIEEENNLTIHVDNSINDRVYPQRADFTFYGGIYRDVEMLIVGKYHFDLDFYGGNGLMVTPRLKGIDGIVNVKCYLNTDKGKVVLTVHDKDGNIVSEGSGMDVNLEITKVHLWDGLNDPYLYTLMAQLYIGEQLADKVQTRFGVREFKMDPKNGFFLNGRSYPLHGVSRHQDRKDMGNAISKEQHKQDFELIREVGANTIRLAHYQHDQYFYDLCDEYGMIVWAEIPYISSHMKNGRENTISQMKELIVQNYNHPSIITWGLSNEITIKTPNKKDMLDNHHVLNDLVHLMDPTRPTSLACYAMCGPFNPVAHITDIVSWNLYLGWYIPGLFLNDLFMRFFHLCFPNRCLGYSEYGAEGMPNLHSSHPRRGDQTEEYQSKYHGYMLKCFARHPFLWSTHVWNMFDFAADARDQGGEPGMNHKGLVTFDREVKKDSFYLYKAYWNTWEPFVHLCSSRYVDREEKVTTIKVYTNQNKVSLYQNDKLLETKEGKHIFTFKVVLLKENRIRAVAGNMEDSVVIWKVEQSNPAYKLQGKSSNSANWV